MRLLVFCIWVAGAIHLVILAANFALPRKLQCRENLARVSPMIREMFIVHWAYIAAILGIFASLCFWFAPELAGGSRLGQFLSAAIAAFWLTRVPLQLFFYDPNIRRQNRAGDIFFLLAFSYLGFVFGIAALGVLR